MQIVAENSPPVYPRTARRSGWGGELLKVQINRSPGHRILDRVARETVRNWRFHAARFNDKPVPAEAMVPTHFEFQEP